MNKDEQKDFVINYVLDWSGSVQNAENWYQSQYISSLDMTPIQAIDSGNYQALIEYLECINYGGFT